MSLRLLQAGQGTTRPLVVAFGPMASSRLTEILGPAPCIVFDSDGHGGETMAQIVDFASNQAGFGAVTGTALIGYSIGCSRVRTLRIAGATAGAFVLVDGTHAGWPPKAWQIAWLRDLADLARRGQCLLVASHTYQTYTERITGEPYASTVTVLRQATGFPLARGGPPEAPILSRDPITGPPNTGLWIYSYTSAETDAKAHIYQGGPALNALVAAHLAPWVASLGLNTTAPQGPPRMLLVGDSHAGGLAAPLRDRVRALGADLTTRAIDGSTIDKWAHGSDLAQALASTTPLLTAVSLGTNDLATKPADYKRALIRSIIEQIRGAGSSAVWILPPGMPIPDRGGLRAILRDELARLSVPAFDSEALELPRGPDGIHPTPKGYEQWATALIPMNSAAPIAAPPPWNTSPQPPWTSPSPATRPSAAPSLTSPRPSGDAGGLAPLAAIGALALLRS